jgi:hypothetical protein
MLAFDRAMVLTLWPVAGVNPRWDTDHIIFTKSSLDLLPQSAASLPEQDHESASIVTNTANPTDGVPTGNGPSSTPIATFKQIEPNQAGRLSNSPAGTKSTNSTFSTPTDQNLCGCWNRSGKAVSGVARDGNRALT